MTHSTQPKSWLESLDTPALTVLPATRSCACEGAGKRDNEKTGTADAERDLLTLQILAAQERIAQLKQLARLEACVSRMERAAALDMAEGLRTELHTLLAGVARHYGLTEALMKSRARESSIVWPRQLYFFLARRLTRASLYQIARMVRRDHGTAMHGITTIANRIEIDPRVREEVAALEAAIETELREEVSTTDAK